MIPPMFIKGAMASKKDLPYPDEGTVKAVVHGWMIRLLAAMVTIAMMLGLKVHYSSASAEQLIWMLLPIARLVDWTTGAHPVWEAGVGFTDFDRGIIIAPACAGVNFLIMAFGLAVLCGLGRLRRGSLLIPWLVFAFCGAYLSALGVNTLRIILSMALYQVDIYTVWLSPRSLHRLAGVWLYLGALGLFFRALQPIITYLEDRFESQCRPARANWTPWLPLGWYLCGAVGMPVANLVFKQPANAFGEHCLIVAAASVLLWVGGVGIKALIARNIEAGNR